MSVSFDFTGKVALVTGSSSGIGAATAILLAKSGADVVVTGRNASKVQSVAKQCSDVSPNASKALEVVADVSEGIDCKRLIDTTVEHFGRIDILVNNAGMSSPCNFNDKEFIQKYRTILGNNLDSAVYLTHLAVEQLERTKGNIINISSIASLITFPDLAHYCMSKSALDMFTKCISVELGQKGIRVNAVNPGAIQTNIFVAGNFGTQEDSDILMDRVKNIYPVGRCGQSDDVARAILFLASNAASFITGITLVIDGGHIAANADMASLLKT